MKALGFLLGLLVRLWAATWRVEVVKSEALYALRKPLVFAFWHGRQMALTPVAEGLVEPVRDILLRVRGTLGSKPSFDPRTTTRHISIAVSDYVAEIVMGDVLRRTQREAPHMTFELRGVGRRATE